ncbi:Uma2 family endonuclease [Streptomyces sp. M2CJ-2]|uniref:Uma2 family endonuclease n=1 Tax=Streptomyces sp. M2CJ-2 TaxID=2803948 RepID=UPI00192626AE|nr:Uma2 family endonuclease [Streptomyces sp. M2CJ-2]MBL3668323.1 Uma2 family endonuclease [Streptomyces sp. M2CJ-2]
MTYDPISEQLLLDWFVVLDPPEGFRAELIEGELVLTPLPDGSHAHCLSLIASQMYTRSRTAMDFSGNKGLKLKGAAACPQDHVIPDGTLAPTERRLYRGADPWMPCEGVALVVEVTWTKPEIDRETKPRCYARGGIPLYLLVDREATAITLFSTPEGGTYRKQSTRPLGKPLPLPDPFAFDLDTADFL